MTRGGLAVLLTLSVAFPVRADIRDDLGDALAAHKNGEMGVAISLYSRTLAGGELSPDLAALAYNNRALALAAAGRLERSLADYDAALALQPDDPELLYNRSLAYLGLRQPERAVEDSERLLRLTPEDGEAFLLGGEAKAALKRHQGAIADFDRALGLSPDLARAYRGRAFSLSATGEHERAIADYDRAVALRPDDAAAHRGRGDTLRRLGRLQEAMADYDRSIALDPTDAEAAYGRGLAGKALGRYGAAIDDFSAAIWSRPAFGTAYKQRGVVRFYLGHFAAAARDLRLSLELDGPRPYRLLWLYLAQARAGFDGRAALATEATKLDPDTWPASVLSLLRGETTPEQLLQSIDATSERRRREALCEAHFYIGQLQLLNDDPGAAADSFRRVIRTGITTFIEYRGAEVELEKMARRVSTVVGRGQAGTAADQD